MKDYSFTRTASMFKQILVVCTGNICRSPIAEGLLKKALPEKQISSAGTAAVLRAPADPHSRAVCAEHDVDVSAHVARQLTLAMLQESDLVLVLDATHAAWLNSRYPQFRGKVHKLGKWQKDVDVPDPYMQPREAFEDCYQTIEAMVQEWLKRV